MSWELYYIGIEIGETTTKIGLISSEGMLLRKRKFSSSIFENTNDFLSDLQCEINCLLGKGIDFFEIRGIGIGAPTANDHTGKVEGPANLTWSSPFDIKSYLEMVWGVDVSVTSEANLVALGELSYGVGRAYSDFVVVTIGAGIGAGIICNRQLVHGVNDLAGEIGHTTLIHDGRSCHCGKNGCFESYVSSGGLVKTYLELTKGNTSTTPIQILNKALNNDEIARKAISETGKYLGVGLANVALTFAPQCIVLSGELANMGDMLITSAYNSFEENLLPNLKGKIKLTVSEHKDNEVSLLGASILVNQNLIDKKLKVID